MAYNAKGPRKSRRKVCQFCVDKAESIDYKDTQKLKKFVSERSKILPRRVTGTCAKHQRELTLALKRARHIALLPYISDSVFQVRFRAHFFYACEVKCHQKRISCS